MIKIDKNVPITSKRVTYPFADLEVGDSFFVGASKSRTARSAACQFGRRYSKKFTCRVVEGGVRVWRIE